MKEMREEGGGRCSMVVMVIVKELALSDNVHKSTLIN